MNVRFDRLLCYYLNVFNVFRFSVASSCMCVCLSFTRTYIRYYHHTVHSCGADEYACLFEFLNCDAHCAREKETNTCDSYSALHVNRMIVADLTHVCFIMQNKD